jgi:hypothetical protein
MNIKKFIYTIAFGLILFNSYSQNNDYKIRKCFNYEHDSCSVSNNIFYKINNTLSRSALFLKGQTSKTPFTVYNGRDYRISLCWDPILGNHILFKILDANTEDVLYDNATNEFSSEFEFTVTNTSKIILVVTVPLSSDEEFNGNKNTIFIQKDKRMGCVGVLIEHMITPTKGF